MENREDIKPSYYGIIPANIRYDNELKANAKLLYSEFSALTNKFGYCNASNNYFAKLYDVDASAVSRWISQLANKGYIKVEYIREGKQIVERRIYIANFVRNNIENPVEDDASKTIPIEKTAGGVLKKEQEGISKNAKCYCQKSKDNITRDNNTSINNTSLNIYSDVQKNEQHCEISQKPKKQKEVKHAYGEYKNVLLSDSELSDLQGKYGAEQVKQKIEDMSSYLAQMGKSYKNYKAAINKWFERDRKQNVNNNRRYGSVLSHIESQTDVEVGF